LSRAPQFILEKGLTQSQPGDIWAEQVDAVIMPATACGSSALLSLSNKQCQIITVEENKTQIQVPPQALNIKSTQVKSYLEAVGFIVAHKAGISQMTVDS